MGLIKGGFQRILQTFLYLLLFLCAGIILGIYSYFLSVLADRNIHIPTWEKAVEGISGAAVVYLIFAVCLTCCLGGIAALAIFAILLDILFAAGMVAIAVLTRHGAGSCKGKVNTPLGTGPASQDGQFGHNGFGTGKGSNVTYAVHLGLACKLNKVAFAVSIIAALLFLCTAGMQVALIQHHKKEKRYGPGPSNNYTSGSAKRGLFGRKKKATATKDAEAGAVATHNGHHNHDNRVSHETGYTGTTAGAAYENDKYASHHAPAHGTNAGYQAPTHSTNAGYQAPSHGTNSGFQVPNHSTHAAYDGPTHGTHSGYHTAPTGTAVNPYGYSNTTTNTATNY